MVRPPLARELKSKPASITPSEERMCSTSRVVEDDLASSLNDAVKPFEQWQSAIRRLFSEEGILANFGHCLLDLLTMCPSRMGKVARSD